MLDILLVEDSQSDAYLTQEILSESQMAHRLHLVRDGVAALDFLYQRGNYRSVSRPDLVLLDLNLPKKNGQEVLEEIQADATLRMIPIIILTTSTHENDMMQSYRWKARGYLIKPLNLNRFLTIVSAIQL